MKNLWIFSLIIGIIILFIFPSPQENFLLYSTTAITFTIITIILFKKFK